MNVVLRLSVPITSVYIVAISPTGEDVPVGTDEDAMVTLTQGLTIGVACVAVVDGTANAPPEVEVTIGDEDETDGFQYIYNSDPVDSTMHPERGPAHYHTVVRLAYVTDQPEVKFDQKLLQCAAVQAGFPKVVATALVEVRCKIHANILLL